MNGAARSILAALAFTLPIVGATLTMSPRPALACPPGCPSPVHPCCCPTPCPTFDGKARGMAQRINDWANEQLDVLGSEIPAFDLAASPLSCLAGGDPSQLASASDAANMGDIGHGLGEGGFTDTPFAFEGEGGFDDLFPSGADVDMLTDGMASDLSDLGSELGLDQIDLGLDGFDMGGLDMGGLSLDGVTMPDLSGFGELPGSISSGLNDLFPVGEGIDAISQGMSEDLGNLGSALGLDNLSMDGFGLGDLGSGLDGLNDGLSQLNSGLRAVQTGDLSALSGAVDFSQLGELFPVGEGMSQITQGMSDDLGRLGDELGVTGDGGLTEILNDAYSSANQGLNDALNTAGDGFNNAAADLGELFPIGEGIDAISQGMSNDLSALQRDLGLAGGGSLDSFMAQVSDGAGSLQDLFPISDGISQISQGMSADLSALSRDLGIANLSLSDLEGETTAEFPSLQDILQQDIQVPEGMDQIRFELPSGVLDDAFASAPKIPGLERLSDIQLLSDLGSIPGIRDSQVVNEAIASGDLSGLISIAKLSDLKGLNSGGDLDKLASMVSGAGIKGLGSLADLGRLSDDLPLQSIADISVLPEISSKLGVSDLGGLQSLGGLTSLGGFSSLADVTKIGAMAKIPGMGTLSGIAAGDPQAAAKALGAVASCAGASTPVTSAMVDSAGLIGSFQSMSNTLGGAGGREVPEVTVGPAKVTIPETYLPDAYLPPVSAEISNKRPNVSEVGRELAARYYSPSRHNDALEAVERGRNQMERRSAVLAYARALQERAELATRTISELAMLEQQPAMGTSVAHDVRINTKLRVELTQRLQEFIELATYMVQKQAATAIAADGEMMLTPSMVAPSPEPRVDKSAETRNATQAAIARSKRFRQAAQDAIDAHNMNVGVTHSKEHLPKLYEIVDEHEARKRHLVAMEREITAHLAALYEDPARAWQTLKSDLISSDGTKYLDANRWAVAESTARGFVPAIFAQVESTRYGRRLRTDCPERARYQSDVPPCPLYTSGPIGASAGRGMIEGHYSGWQRYKVVRQMTPARRTRDGLEGGSPPHFDAVFQSIQYYLEARKRKLYWDGSRRGTNVPDGTTTTADLWNELSAQAPSCLSGPLPVSPENLSRRPDLFDIDPDCDHRIWKKPEYSGLLINHMQLGGVDQSIWIAKNAEYEAEVAHGAREGAVARVKAAREIAGDSLVPELKKANRGDLAAKMTAYLKALDKIEADTGSQTRVTSPDE